MASDSSAHESPLRVGYILKMFPRLSETFILNEILAHEARGLDVSVFSLMFPIDGRYHGRLANLKLTVDHVIRDKADGHWQVLRSEAPDEAPSLEGWQEAVDFLARYDIPKDFELLLRAARIAAEVKKRKIQHLHAHFATVATRVAAMVNMMTGVPFSFTSHAKDIFRDTVNRDLYKELVDRSAFNITVSDFNRQYILEKTPGVDAEKVVRLYNGIDLDYFQLATGERNGNVPHIVSVGRLVPKKGFNFLLDALATWKRAGKKFRATLIGGGEDEAALHEHHRRLDLGESTHFTGALPQEEVRRIVADADLTVLACVPDSIGNMDALPTTLLESLALGVPIVSTTLTGVPEIVGDDCGVLVEHSSADALVRGMDEMLARIAAGSFAPEAARQRARDLFDLPTNAGQLADRFEISVRGDVTQREITGGNIIQGDIIQGDRA